MLYKEEEENNDGLYKLNKEVDVFMFVDHLHKVAQKHSEFNTLYLIMWLKIKLVKGFITKFERLYFKDARLLQHKFSDGIKAKLLKVRKKVRDPIIS